MNYPKIKHYSSELFPKGFFFHIFYLLASYRTEKVVEYQNSLPSVKKAHKIREIREKFDSIFDESTIEIHKRLEELLK